MNRYWPIKTTADRLREYWRVMKKKGKLTDRGASILLMNDNELMQDQVDNITKYTNSEYEANIEAYRFGMQWEWLRNKRTTVYIPKDIGSWLFHCGIDDYTASHCPKTFDIPFAMSFEKGFVIDILGEKIEPHACFISMMKFDERTNFFYVASHADDINKNRFEYIRTNRTMIHGYTFGQALFQVDETKGNLLGIAYAKLAALVCLYGHTFPEAIKKGPPKDETISYKGAAFYLNNPGKGIIGEHGSPCAHWRRGHFRTLRADRFKRNDDGSFRIVFVHDCIVAQKDQELYHVSDGDE